MIRYPCTCKDEDVEHEFVSERPDFSRLSLVPELIYTIECADCRHRFDMPKEEWDEISKQEDLHSQRHRRVSLTRYPRIEPHSGAVVHSRDHEKETLKAMGFHAAEHGVNDKFNDETTEKLVDKRRRINEKRAAIRKKREGMMREGVIKRRPLPVRK